MEKLKSYTKEQCDEINRKADEKRQREDPEWHKEILKQRELYKQREDFLNTLSQQDREREIARQSWLEDHKYSEF